MYNKLLVTLDGSPLAEAAIPYAAGFADSVGVEEMMLLRFVVEGSGLTLGQSDQYLLDRAKELVATLKGEEVDRSLLPCHGESPHGVQCISRQSPIERVADSILQFLEDRATDILIMSSHGASGLERWPLGTVAEKVVRAANIPVLLVRPTKEQPVATPVLKRLLVPLEGSVPVEQAWQQLERLGKSGESEVTLLFVDPCLKGDLESAAWPNSALGQHHMRSYFGSLAAHLEGKGIKAHTKVRAGQPGQQIIDEAQAASADLIVLSSFKPTGLTRWVQGSVVDQVIRGSTVPVLLIPVNVQNDVTLHQTRS